MSYTTIQNIKNYTLLNIDEAFEPAVERWIESVSKYINQYTNRKFEADTEFSEKKYDGTGTKLLVTDDFVELDKVLIGDTEIDVLAYPPNDKPKTWLESRQGFRRGRQNIAVNAKWGYSEEVPKDIEFATTVLVVGMINDSNPTAKKIESESIGQYRVSYRNGRELSDFNQVKEILWLYRKHL